MVIPNESTQALLPDEREQPTLGRRVVVAGVFMAILFAAWQLLGPGTANAGWNTDIQTAMATAKEQRKPIIVLFPLLRADRIQ